MKFITLILVLCFSFSLCSASFFNHSGTWYTSENSNFKFHYTAQSKHLVPLIQALANQAHKKITQALYFDPVQYMKQKTHIVLIDSTDYANGGAAPLPQNTIYIYLSYPLEGSILDNYENYLLTLITHEYTHIVQLSTKKGYSSFLYSIFGNIIAPNILQPLWLTEGYAVWAESYLTDNLNTGRLHSAQADMIVASSFCNNSFPSIDTLPYITAKWPMGNTPYLFGADFLNYLSKKYGHKSLGTFNLENAATIPFFINIAASSTWKKNFFSLYPEYIQHSKNKYLSRCKTAQFQEIEQHTSDGYFKDAIGKLNGKILFAAYTPTTGSYIGELAEDNSLIVKAKYSTFGRNISTNNNILVFSKISTDVYANSFSYLYFFNLKQKKLKRIKLRVRDPEISKSSNFIVAVKLAPSKNSLVLIKNKAQEKISFESKLEDLALQTILDPPQGVRIGTPLLSNDNNLILFTLKEAVGTNIFIYNIRAKTLKQITFGTHNLLTPRWIDNSNIVYTSDQNGTPNIYTLNLKTMLQKQLTNLRTGADQALFNNNRIYFFYYGKSGYNLSSFKYNPSHFFKSKKLTSIKSKTSKTKIAKISSTLKEEKYRSIYNIAPKSWLPLGQLFEHEDKLEYNLGLITFGTDPLLKDMYLLAPYYDSYKNDILYYAFWDHSFGRSSINLSTSYNYYNFTNKYTNKDYTITFNFPFKQDLATFGNPFDTNETSAYLTFSYVDDPRFWKSNFIRLGLIKKNRSKRTDALYYHTGNLAAVQSDFYDKVFDSNYRQVVIKTVVEKYFKLFSLIYYTPKLYSAHVTKQYNYFELGGSQTNQVFYKANFNPQLRGYKQDSIFGRTYGSINQEIHFPIKEIYRGIAMLPYFVKKLAGVVSFDNSFVKRVNQKTKHYSSWSLALKKQFIAAYYLPLSLKLEYSRGLKNNGISTFNLSLASEI